MRPSRGADAGSRSGESIHPSIHPLLSTGWDCGLLLCPAIWQPASSPKARPEGPGPGRPQQDGMGARDGGEGG